MSRAESDFFNSVPETWVIFVSLKISLNFVFFFGSHENI